MAREKTKLKRPFVIEVPADIFFPRHKKNSGNALRGKNIAALMVMMRAEENCYPKTGAIKEGRRARVDSANIYWNDTCDKIMFVVKWLVGGGSESLLIRVCCYLAPKRRQQGGIGFSSLLMFLINCLALSTKKKSRAEKPTDLWLPLVD
jgi:hypothetical protein